MLKPLFFVWKETTKKKKWKWWTLKTKAPIDSSYTTSHIPLTIVDFTSAYMYVCVQAHAWILCMNQMRFRFELCRHLRVVQLIVKKPSNGYIDVSNVKKNGKPDVSLLYYTPFQWYVLEWSRSSS